MISFVMSQGTTTSAASASTRRRVHQVCKANTPVMAKLTGKIALTWVKETMASITANAAPNRFSSLVAWLELTVFQVSDYTHGGPRRARARTSSAMTTPAVSKTASRVSSTFRSTRWTRYMPTSATRPFIMSAPTCACVPQIPILAPPLTQATRARTKGSCSNAPSFRRGATQ